MMAVVGTLSFNFQVLLPLLASFTWHGTAQTYTALAVAMGVGSVAGALAAGARGRADARLLVGAAAAFGIAELLVAAAPSIPLQLAALIPLGAVSVTFAAGVNSAMQLAVDPAMRGRVMALYSVVFLGSTPIGAPLVGWIAEVAGPRAGLRARRGRRASRRGRRRDRVRAGGRAGRGAARVRGRGAAACAAPRPRPARRTAAVAAPSGQQLDPVPPRVER